MVSFPVLFVVVCAQHQNRVGDPLVWGLLRFAPNTVNSKSSLVQYLYGFQKVFPLNGLDYGISKHSQYS